MNARALAHLIVIALVPVFVSLPARAETLKTTGAAKLRERPGESEAVVAVIEDGQDVTVLKRSGRWIRVQSGDRQGWLTRTHVRTAERDKKEQRATRSQSWKRKDGDKKKQRPVDKKRLVQVSRDKQKAFREPTGKSREAFAVRKGTVVTVVGSEKDGEWLLVENEHGHLGWIPALAVSPVSETAGAAAGVRSERERDAGPDRVWSPARASGINVVAGVGYRMLDMDFSSNGNAGLGNYRVSAPAATAVIAARVPLLSSSSMFVVELDTEYRFSLAEPGIHYESSTGAVGDIPFSAHEVHAGGKLGVRLADNTLMIAARAGYHYGLLSVSNLDNVGRLPRERLQGLRAGGRAHYAPTSTGLVVRAGFDLLTGGKRSQTPGLEDGTDSTASAWWGFLGVDYPISSSMQVGAGYSYERAATDWTGQSTRQADVTQASRVDQTHAVYMGMTRSF